MSITELRALLEELLQDRDPAVADLSRRIFAFLVETPRDKLKMLTFKVLAAAGGRDSVDENLLSALVILENTRAHLLETHLLLIDDNDDEFEIDRNELAEAREQGALVHPSSGNLILDFEEKVFPFFAPSDLLLKAKSDQ